MPLRDVPKENGKIQNFEDYKAGLEGVYQNSYDGYDGFNDKTPNHGLIRERYEKQEKDARKLSFAAASLDLSRIICVKGNILQKVDRDGHQYFPVILAEKNSAHPTGEIYIADNLTVHEVACTERVVEKIRDLELVIVEKVEKVD